ncbi:MAG: DNA topoisomerase IB [Gemmatimonadota bacterium]|nr:DNA topoisomerase IB [Gemmatimonadota bacterium]
MTTKRARRGGKLGQSVSREYEDTAEAAGLRYVTDAMPGIRRQPHGRGFRYIDPEGRVIRAPALLQRFRALVIPPAWTEVWICPLEDGHLQVTARDGRGRKQYRYHPGFRQHRDGTKFERMFELSDVLWKIRERVETDIELPGFTRDKIMATLVWLLETTLIRIGSDEYAKANKSYGLTTFRRRHVAVVGSKMRFEFRGKSGIQHAVAVTDKRIARIVQRCQELRGEELFKYLDDDGKRQVVQAEDVNAYLQTVTGRDITAKDFRTWAGTMLAADALRQTGPAKTKKEAERNIVAAVDLTAKRLGNTRSVCRKYYIHPALLEAYLEGLVLPPLPERKWSKRKTHGPTLRQHEMDVLAFLKARLKPEKRRLAASRYKKSSVQPIETSAPDAEEQPPPASAPAAVRKNELESSDS